MRSSRTMDTLPAPPPSFEQIVTRKLVQCGLAAEGVRVTYEHVLQSYEVVIKHSAQAIPAMFGCIRESTGGEFVTFDDRELMGQYYSFLREASLPQVMARAEAMLAEQGRLQGLPHRPDFASDILFAEALEVHCGVAKGEAIRPFEGALAFQPPPELVRNIEAFQSRYSCLLAAIQLVGARGELSVMFIGYVADAPD